MTAEEVLRAYKRQPVIEKRFSQFKSDFHVAPLYLKEVSRPSVSRSKKSVPTSPIQSVHERGSCCEP
jgi:hypothetical protein